MNASAQPIRPGTDPKEIVALLKRIGERDCLRLWTKSALHWPRQLTNPVLWDDSVNAILKEGLNELLGT